MTRNLLRCMSSEVARLRHAGDVRSSVAIEGKANVTRTVHFGSE